MEPKERVVQGRVLLSCCPMHTGREPITIIPVLTRVTKFIHYSRSLRLFPGHHLFSLLQYT